MSRTAKIYFKKCAKFKELSNFRPGSAAATNRRRELYSRYSYLFSLFAFIQPTKYPTLKLPWLNFGQVAESR